MRTNPLASDIKPLRQLLEKKLGARGRSFDAQVRKAGRRLPSKARKQAAQIIEAETLATHPKLAGQADLDGARQAAKDLKAYLKSVDGTDRYRGAFLGWATALVANLIIAGVIAIVIWLLLK